MLITCSPTANDDDNELIVARRVRDAGNGAIPAQLLDLLYIDAALFLAEPESQAFQHGTAS
jgi:hypothetical protein